MWLRDFLPSQLPKTRIMTYGYNSNVFDSASTTTIPEFAQGLLGALTNARSGPKERKRPIVFVCHSLGGIVVKLVVPPPARPRGVYAGLQMLGPQLGPPAGGHC
jgi:hypothetical protein